MRSMLEETECSGFDDDLRTALHLQFAADVRNVLFRRMHTDDEVTGDLAVGRSLKEQPQHLALALGQRFCKWTGASRGEREI